MTEDTSEVVAVNGYEGLVTMTTTEWPRAAKYSVIESEMFELTSVEAKERGTMFAVVANAEDGWPVADGRMTNPKFMGDRVYGVYPTGDEAHAVNEALNLLESGINKWHPFASDSGDSVWHISTMIELAKIAEREHRDHGAHKLVDHRQAHHDTYADIYRGQVVAMINLESLLLSGRLRTGCRMSTDQPTVRTTISW
jgi:hypothetical protein